MARKSFRMKFMFWLDVTKRGEDELIGQIEDLKRERLFAKTIRDGIRMICDLRAGQTDVLFELFPWVKDTLQSAPPAPVEKGLQEQITRLEALLLAQGNVPIRSPQTLEPTRIERESRVKIATASSKADARTVAQNFANSLRSVASGFFD